MNLRVSAIKSLGRMCVVSWLFAGSALSQVVTLDSLVVESRTAMDEQAWEKALALNNQAVTQFGGDQPLKMFGPQFGIIFYRKGLCEMKLKRWSEAMVSFETCYRDFPNGKSEKDGGNTYQKLALLKWAEAAMGAEQWELALARFRKFIEERDKVRDKYPQGAYQVNLAICLYKLGQIVEGSENLEIAIRNRDVFPTPDVGIMAGFQALVGAAIDKKNEQAVLDFMGKNRSGLSIGPYEMYRFSPTMMKLAGDAVACGMWRAALALYQLVPSTDIAINDVRARLKAMGAAAEVKMADSTLTRVRLEEDLAAFEADRRGKQATEAIKLAAVALIHEASGNFPGAFAAYQQMESYYPAVEKHEENLFNLIRVASRVGQGVDVRNYGAVFMKDFPQSGKVTDVRRLILTTLDGEGDAADGIAVAGPMLESLVEGTPEHDLCLFVLAVSYFNSGAYDKAREMFDRHVKLYQAGDRSAEVAFYQASSAARLGLWEVAAAGFDAFFAKYPDNPWLAAALYERATVYLASGQPEAARGLINRLIKEFPGQPLNVRALNLLGDVESVLGNAGESEKAYLMAFKAASAGGDRSSAGESLCHLVELLVNSGDAAKRMSDATVHADRFWKEYAEGSALQTRVAVAQVRAFVSSGRGDEALQRLREIAAKGGIDPGQIGMLIDAYTEAFLGSHGPEELEKQLENFPGIDPANKATQSHLRLAVIGAYEKVAREAKDETRRTRVLEKLRVLYQKLKTDFTPGELDPRALVRLGDHLRLTTSTPREALVFYDEVFRRNDAVAASVALLGRADIRVRSTDPVEIDQGIDDFRKASAELKTAEERGYAYFRMVESLMAKGDFEKAAEQAAAYLNGSRQGISGFTAQVGLMLARAYQELKRTDEAVDEYARLWKAHTEDVSISAPALVSWMQLLWTRNHEGGELPDRQAAYEEGLKYLDRTRGLVAALKDKDLGPWHEIQQAVKTFATSPGIKPLTAPAIPTE